MRLLVPPGGAAGGVLLQLVTIGGLVPNGALAVLAIVESWAAVAFLLASSGAAPTSSAAVLSVVAVAVSVVVAVPVPVAYPIVATAASATSAASAGSEGSEEAVDLGGLGRALHGELVDERRVVVGGGGGRNYLGRGHGRRNGGSQQEGDGCPALNYCKNCERTVGHKPADFYQLEENAASRPSWWNKETHGIRR